MKKIIGLIVMLVMLSSMVSAIDYTELSSEKKSQLMKELKSVNTIQEKQEIYKEYTGEYFNLQTTKLSRTQQLKLLDELDLSLSEQKELAKLLGNESLFQVQSRNMHQNRVQIRAEIKEGNNIILENDVVEAEYDVDSYEELEDASDVIESLPDTQRKRIQEMNQLKIHIEEDGLRFEAKERQRFFGLFEFDREINYRIQNEEVVREKSAFDWMWRN